MAILDFLKSKWSANSMTAEDRQRLFWYLKRKTSYTAWKREADRFSKFVAIAEKQAKEEPTVRGKWDYVTNWEDVYVEALKGEVHYEKGLNRLRLGDRTVWLYNSLGEFDDATTVANEWHSEIVNGGRESDPYKYQGKYLNDMKSILQWFFEANDDTGYLQPMMANISAVETWYKERHERLLALPCPVPLPEVPPYTEITVRTGEPTPVFGIYEPQIKDGCMNYLLQGEPARSYSSTPVDYNGQPVTWRLIWQDHRYEDGSIPEEELQYFPNDSPAPTPYIEPTTHSSESMIVAESGDPAPRSGRWAVQNDLNGVVQIEQQGDVLPSYQGRNVTWVWSSE